MTLEKSLQIVTLRGSQKKRLGREIVFAGRVPDAATVAWFTYDVVALKVAAKLWSGCHGS
jgi:hypothetical protein